MRIWFPFLFSPRTFPLSKACDLGIHELRDVEAALGALHELSLLEDTAQGAGAFSQHQNQQRVPHQTPGAKSRHQRDKVDEKVDVLERVQDNFPRDLGAAGRVTDRLEPRLPFSGPSAPSYRTRERSLKRTWMSASG